MSRAQHRSRAGTRAEGNCARYAVQLGAQGNRRHHHHYHHHHHGTTTTTISATGNRDRVRLTSSCHLGCRPHQEGYSRLGGEFDGESTVAHGNLNERAESKARMCSVERRARDGLASATTRVLLPLGSGPTASTMLPLRSLPPLDLSFSRSFAHRASFSFSLHLFPRLSFFLLLFLPALFLFLSFSLLLPCSFPSFLLSFYSLLSFFISFPPPRVISSRSTPLGLATRRSPRFALI